MNKVERASLNDLCEILQLFDSVQAWLVGQGLTGQWGDVPFSVNQPQRGRFAVWLEAGDFYVVRAEAVMVATLVLTARLPDYARSACQGRPEGSYLEAFTVHRAHSGRNVGSVLLAWAEAETYRRGLRFMYLDCWAGNPSLRAYYRRAGFGEVATLNVGSWQGVLFNKELKAPV